MHLFTYTVSFTCEDEDKDINNEDDVEDNEEKRCETPAIPVLSATPPRQENCHKPHVSSCSFKCYGMVKILLKL